MPIIGTTGFTLYALYVKMSNRKDERAYPGFRSISEHFGFSHVTIACYNWLLERCRLIHIERYQLPDGRRYRNQYLILPIPEVTRAKLDYMYCGVATALWDEIYAEKPNERWVAFLDMVLLRICDWQSLPEIWARNRPEKGIKVIKAQMELPFVGDKVGDNADLAVSSGHNPGILGTQPRCPKDSTSVSQGHNPGIPRIPEQSEETKNINNPKEQSETDSNGRAAVSDDVLDALFNDLLRVGVDDSVAGDLLQDYGPMRIQRQLDWLPRRVEEYRRKRKQIRGKVGFLIKSIVGDWSEPMQDEGGVSDRRRYVEGKYAELIEW